MANGRSRDLTNRHASVMAAVVCMVCFSLGSFALGQPDNSTAKDPRLQKAYRFHQAGWTYVHLEGSPAEIGFQHGALLAPEIADAFAAIKLFDTHQSQRDWEFFRTAARLQINII